MEKYKLDNNTVLGESHLVKQRYARMLLPVGGLSLDVLEAGAVGKLQFLLGSILWSKRRLLRLAPDSHLILLGST